MGATPISNIVNQDKRETEQKPEDEKNVRCRRRDVQDVETSRKSRWKDPDLKLRSHTEATTSDTSATL